MNLIPKAKWINALRSGEYERGFIVLRHKDLYCPLGILTDLYIKEFKKEWYWLKNTNRWSFEGETLRLSDSVKEWAGLARNVPALEYKHQGTYPLPYGNDVLGIKPAQLADMIEAQL